MEQDSPGKDYKSQKVREWLKNLKLTEQIDRMEIDAHLKIWEILDEQILKIEHACFRCQKTLTSCPSAELVSVSQNKQL